MVYANPTKVIERAYGAWLHAPSKNMRAQSLGSKWLRNGGNGAQNKWSDGKEMAAETTSGEETVMANFMETDGKVCEISGGKE